MLRSALRRASSICQFLAQNPVPRCRPRTWRRWRSTRTRAGGRPPSVGW